MKTPSLARLPARCSNKGASLTSLLTFAFLLSAISAQARPENPSSLPEEQSSLKQLTLQQLGEVEVTTAAKTPEQAWKTPAAIYVITQEDIERSGGTTIPGALRLAPGVEVAQISSDKWSIGIRGFGSRLSRDVLVLIDGRTVYTTLLAGTYWEVQNVVLEDVDRIEVIRGPGGTIWGPNAVNGVINIITKSSKDTHGVMVSASAGNVNRGILNAGYGGGAGAFHYRIYGWLSIAARSSTQTGTTTTSGAPRKPGSAWILRVATTTRSRCKATSTMRAQAKL